MKVKDIMTKNVVTTSLYTPLKEVIKIMHTNNVKSLIVEKENEQDAYGILTYISIIREIIQDEGDIELLKVYDICDKPAVAISQELDIKYAAKLMLHFNIRRAIVTENNKLVGLISQIDVFKRVFTDFLD